MTPLTITPGASVNTDRMVRRIATVALVLGAISMAWMAQRNGPLGALSSALGTLVGMANLWALAKLVTKLTDRRAAPDKGRAGVLLALKTVTLFALVGVLVMAKLVYGGSFMAGITAVVVAIAAGGLWASLEEETAEGDDNGANGPNDPG